MATIKKKKFDITVPPAPEQKPWAITQADIDATTKAEVAFSTTRCLPPEDQIPDMYWGWAKNQPQNIYTHVADALFCGNPMPAGEVVYNEGFREDNEAMGNFIMAHLRSFAPSHEHKMAAIAYMIATIMTITPEPSNGKPD